MYEGKRKELIQSLIDESLPQEVSNVTNDQIKKQVKSYAPVQNKMKSPVAQALIAASK